MSYPFSISVAWSANNGTRTASGTVGARFSVKRATISEHDINATMAAIPVGIDTSDIHRRVYVVQNMGTEDAVLKVSGSVQLLHFAIPAGRGIVIGPCILDNVDTAFATGSIQNILAATETGTTRLRILVLVS